MNNQTTVEQRDRELVITRTINGPPHLVFEAWTQPELFKQWWVPKSCGLSMLSCELDVRTGGRYRLVYQHPAAPEPMAFHGRYLEVTPPSRIVWTNEEGGDAGQVSTVTFEKAGSGTRVVLVERFPTKEAFDEAIASGSMSGNVETFEQLEAFVTARAAT